MPDNTTTSVTELYRRASKSDATVEEVQALRRHYEACPPSNWNLGIATLTLEGALKELGNAALAEATRAGIRKLRQELGYTAAPPLEKLLIDHITLCWVDVHHVQWQYDAVTARQITLNQGAYWDKRLSTSQRRFLRAAESLARVRRMRLPAALQVNIGGPQLNIAG